MIFPGGAPNGFASGMRAWFIAEPLRREGFRVVVVPPDCNLRHRQKLHRRERPHFVFFQKCRDPLHDPELFPGSRAVLDVDDADFLDPRLQQRMERVASQCVAGIAGSRFVADWMRQFCPNVEIVWTGIEMGGRPQPSPPSSREAVVAYAVSNAILAKAEAEFVRDVAVEAARHSRFTLQIHSGGDLGQVAEIFRPVADLGVPIRYLGWMTMDNMIKALSSASVGLAPLLVERGGFVLGKSFGKVLAYLAAGVPVVASDAVDHPLLLTNGVNGFVLPNEVDTWSATVTSLLAEPKKRDAVADEAWKDLGQRLSCSTAAKRIRGILQSQGNYHMRDPT